MWNFGLQGWEAKPFRQSFFHLFSVFSPLKSPFCSIFYSSFLLLWVISPSFSSTDILFLIIIFSIKFSSLLACSIRKSQSRSNPLCFSLRYIFFLSVPQLFDYSFAKYKVTQCNQIDHFGFSVMIIFMFMFTLSFCSCLSFSSTDRKKLSRYLSSINERKTLILITVLNRLPRSQSQQSKLQSCPSWPNDPENIWGSQSLFFNPPNRYYQKFVV